MQSSPIGREYPRTSLTPPALRLMKAIPPRGQIRDMESDYRLIRSLYYFLQHAFKLGLSLKSRCRSCSFCQLFGIRQIADSDRTGTGTMAKFAFGREFIRAFNCLVPILLCFKFFMEPE